MRRRTGNVARQRQSADRRQLCSAEYLHLHSFNQPFVHRFFLVALAWVGCRIVWHLRAQETGEDKYFMAGEATRSLFMREAPASDGLQPKRNGLQPRRLGNSDVF